MKEKLSYSAEKLTESLGTVNYMMECNASMCKNVTVTLYTVIYVSGTAHRSVPILAYTTITLFSVVEIFLDGTRPKICYSNIIRYEDFSPLKFYYLIGGL